MPFLYHLLFKAYIAFIFVDLLASSGIRMEPLPSDVARLVLGYLLDACPEVADQFFAKSRDLAEMRRIRRHPVRPFGQSLIDVLTEHATVFSLAYDASGSELKSLGAPVGDSDFLCKMRDLLSFVMEKQKCAEPAADIPAGCSQPPGAGGEGARQCLEAATAGLWASDPRASCVETPALGGDWADTPTAEAALAGTPGVLKASRDPSHNSMQNSVPEVSSEFPGSEMNAAETASYLDISESEMSTSTDMQTSPTPEDASGTGGVSETSERPLRSSERSQREVGGNADSRPAAPTEGDRSRRKSRPPRRSDPEVPTALAGRRIEGRPAGWLFGQVRHCLKGEDSAAAGSDPQSAPQPSPRLGLGVSKPPSSKSPHSTTLQVVKLLRAQRIPRRRSLPAHLRAAPAGPAAGPSRMSAVSATLQAGPSVFPDRPSVSSDLPDIPPPAPPFSLPVLPMKTASPAVLPVQTASPAVITVQTASPAVLPVQTVSPASLPLKTASPSLPVQTASPPALPVQTENPAILPIQKDSLPIFPSQTASPPNFPVSPPVLPVQTDTRPEAGGRQTERKRPAPRRRSPEQCGTTLVGSGAVRNRPTADGGKSAGMTRRERATERVAARGEDSVAKSLIKADVVLKIRAGMEKVIASSAKRVVVSESSPVNADGTEESQGMRGETAPAAAEDSPRSLSPGVHHDFAQPSTSSPHSPDATCVPPPSPAGSCDHQPLPPEGDSGTPGTGGVPPTPSQPPDQSHQSDSDRASQACDSERSGRSTPLSQRSLRICLSPVSIKTPSLSGSYLVEETPTSARRGSRQGATAGGSSSGLRRLSAPRRRLLSELRRRSESPRAAPRLGAPSAQSTPATASATDPASPVVGLRRTPRRAARRTTAASPGDRGDRPVREATRKRPLAATEDGPEAQRVKVPSNSSSSSNRMNLLKSIDIMSFLSRIHN